MCSRNNLQGQGKTLDYFILSIGPRKGIYPPLRLTDLYVLASRVRLGERLQTGRDYEGLSLAHVNETNAEAVAQLNHQAPTSATCALARRMRRTPQQRPKIISNSVNL